jgi:hypothetical protein
MLPDAHINQSMNQSINQSLLHLHTCMLYGACRVRDELDRLEQQQRARVEEEEELLAAAVEAEKAQSSLPHRVKPAMALALVNMRNRWEGACVRHGRTCMRACPAAPPVAAVVYNSSTC